jgi:murein DD-endopeptidase MepM/ murein hydrolase activator NlpD
MMREPVKPQTYNPALEREKKTSALETQQQTQKPNEPNQEPNKLENPSTVQYEVFLEQVAHDMGYEDTLKPEQQALLEQFGYSDGGLVNGPFGFEMRSFIPSDPAYPHPILAFRGTEFSKIKDIVADLEPQSVGLQQFNANRHRIELELQKLSKHGKVWLTGHSLGGALAQLAGSEFADQTGRIITFQSPGIDAKHVTQLKKHNKANPDQQVLSTHYQVAGDVVSGVGQALTPGELVKFEMNPSSGASMKHYAVGMIAGAVVGPGTGVVVKTASDAVAKHRAFPVSNAVQENPAFQDLFDNGKKFDKVAGISDDTFQAKANVSSDVFQNTRISEFLRHTIGKASFEIENATSNWGGDAKARDFAKDNKKNIPDFTSTQLLEHLNRLLDGWVSDDDVEAFETICHGVTDPRIMNEIRNELSSRLEELHSEHQRKWIEDAINLKPIPDDKAVQRDALGMETTTKPNIQNLSGGSALESTQRKELEEHFDTNLGDVRIHTDDNAHKLAKDLNAKAAAIGENIILSETASITDKELAGHEIAHVIQQREGKVSAGIDKDPDLEAEAQLEGQNFAAGTKVRGKRAMLEVKKPTGDTVQRKELAEPSGKTKDWNNRQFSATLTGTDGDRRIDFTLDRQDNKVSGSFAIHGTGRGNVRGEYNPKDKASPLRLECVFTEITPEKDPEETKKKQALVGKTRVLDGWFLYAESGSKKDENNDGKDDSSKAALPLLIGGIWKGGTKEYKLEPITPQVSTGGAWVYNPKSGNKNFTQEVATEVLWAAGELEVNPNDLAACMSFESGGSFDPAQKNLGGGAAVGLIQFLPPSLEQMRMYIASGARKKAIADEIKKYSWDSSKLNRASLIAMTVKEQMRYVVLHFKAHNLKPGSTFVEMYKKIIAPNADPDAMYIKGSAGYRDNEPLDKNGDDKITAAEAASVIEDRGHVRDYFTSGTEDAASVAQKQNTPQSQSATANPNGSQQQQDPNHIYTVTTLTTSKKIKVKASQLSMQGAYPTDIDTINWQPTSIANPKTADALSDVRGTTVKLGEKEPQTGTEFLASGRDYANLRSGGIKQVHTGWDLNIVGDDNLKKPAYFAADGVVVFVGDLAGFRKTIVVYHPQLNRWTRYAHLGKYSVSEGAIVKAGQQLGTIGNAEKTQDAHLHFDVIKNLKSAGMWNGANSVKDGGDYDKDGDFDVDDRIEYVKENYEDPAAFFATVGVAIPEKK